MRRAVFILMLLVISIGVVAQSPSVPSRMTFADIDLKINDGARREIQGWVDDLTQSPKYFEIKADRARLYFPIIERILAEEEVPDDVKFLVIQESALIADAVSVSNAVGFWQFKDFTAAEMGLRVDKRIDERLNIVSSTRAAAKYFKKNNFFFNNWLYALQAYQMGAGGVQKAENDKFYGAKSMTITKGTYWYVKKYIAHKVAYQDAVQEPHSENLRLLEYTRGSSKQLDDIANELVVNYNELEAYNVWLKKGAIPNDKTYTVVVPVVGSQEISIADISGDSELEDVVAATASTTMVFKGIEAPAEYPKMSEKKGLFSSERQLLINGIPGVVAAEGQSVTDLAARAGLSVTDFCRFNEIYPHDDIVVGQVYYSKKKKNKAKVHYHTVEEGETLWQISQKYGVKSQKVLQKNRIASASELKAGLVLWIRYIRPAEIDPVYKFIPQTPQPTITSVVKSMPKQEFSIENHDFEQAPAGRTIHHLVRSKETLYSISNHYGVAVMDVVRQNDLDINDGIRAGQSLEINVPLSYSPPQTLTSPVINTKPTTEEPQMIFSTYKVKKGDTMYSIANELNVAIDDLLDWNGKTDYSLSIGEELKVQKQQ